MTAFLSPNDVITNFDAWRADGCLLRVSFMFDADRVCGRFDVRVGVVRPDRVGFWAPERDVEAFAIDLAPERLWTFSDERYLPVDGAAFERSLMVYLNGTIDPAGDRVVFIEPKP